MNKVLKFNSDVPTASIYARYSSHAQRDVSIEQQIKACRLFAERQGIEVVSVYEDRALTGTNDRRPGFQKMIKDAEKGDWNYVIVYTLDRFARDRYDSAIYKRQLKNCGVRVLSAMENISDDPTGVLMESMLEGLAEYYSKELSRKINRGLEDNAAKCMVTGPLPYGYYRAADGRYAINETQASVVREIFQRVNNDERLLDIIEDLNSRGLKTKTGKPWNRSSFNTMLSNERYTGVYIFRDVRVPGGIPPIISRELFDAVQYRLGSKKNPRSSAAPQRRRRDNSVYLLTGKLFCGKCKSPMVGTSGTSRHGNMFYYYICKNRRQGHTCDKAALRRDRIERSISAALKDNMLNDRAIAALADAAIEHQDKTFQNIEVDILKKRLSEIRQSTKNLVAAIEAGVFSAATQSRLMELEAEEKLVAGQLTIAEQEAEQRLTKNEIIAALKLYQDGDIEDKEYQEALIDMFLVAAYVYDDHIKIIFWLGGKNKEVSVPFDIDAVTTDENGGVCISAPNLHQIKDPPVGGFFIWSAGNRIHPNADVRWTSACRQFNDGNTIIFIPLGV